MYKDTENHSYDILLSYQSIHEVPMYFVDVCFIFSKICC